MNVELFFVRADHAAVIELVNARLGSAERTSEESPLPSSYQALLRDEPRRRIAVSHTVDGWTAVIESREVVDFELARIASARLRTRVVVIQAADTVGARGIAVYESGAVVEADYSEDDPDPDATLRAALEANRIVHTIPLFREVVRGPMPGWTIVSALPK